MPAVKIVFLAMKFDLLHTKMWSATEIWQKMNKNENITMIWEIRNKLCKDWMKRNKSAYWRAKAKLFRPLSVTFQFLAAQKLKYSAPYDLFDEISVRWRYRSS